MERNLKGKVALVSGSTSGIGLAIATALAAEGAQVAVNGRTDERVRKAVERIGQIVPDAQLIPAVADASTPDGAQTLFAFAPHVDILVNNLGIYDAKPFEEIADSDWETIFQVNVMSGVRLSRHYLKAMLSAGWGRILFISSESALNIPKEMIHYGVTKTAQAALARGLAELTVGTAVTINSVLAGPTRSEGVENFIQGLATSRGIDTAQVEREFFTDVRPSSLLQRFIEPEEIASVVAFLAGSQAVAINGAAIRAEGGVVRSVF